ncbi:hypothetical protein [Reyranella sp.]|uniref:hypothetical protein n=1 Tax=Reyranella sp. TaxID=1929291 RepID=UPI003D12F37A
MRTFHRIDLIVAHDACDGNGPQLEQAGVTANAGARLLLLAPPPGKPAIMIR